MFSIQALTALRLLLFTILLMHNFRFLVANANTLYSACIAKTLSLSCLLTRPVPYPSVHTQLCHCPH